MYNKTNRSTVNHFQTRKYGKFEDTRSRKSMKVRQYNYKQKVDNDLQSITQQTKKSDNMNPNKHRS